MSQRDGRYHEIYRGEAIKIRSGGVLRFACCDCGLVHDIVVKYRRGGWILLGAYRSRATGGHRRKAGLPEKLRALADRLDRG